VSEQERIDYAAKIASGSCNEEAVTLENYRIDLGSNHKSAWNQSAGRVLVPYFTDKSGLSLKDHPGLYTMIISAFSSHLKSIRDNSRYSLTSAHVLRRKRQSTRTNKVRIWQNPLNLLKCCFASYSRYEDIPSRHIPIYNPIWLWLSALAWRALRTMNRTTMIPITHDMISATCHGCPRKPQTGNGRSTRLVV